MTSTALELVYLTESLAIISAHKFLFRLELAAVDTANLLLIVCEKVQGDSGSLKIEIGCVHLKITVGRPEC